MKSRIAHKLNVALERHLPEQRLFLRSDHETRFIRLYPVTQAIALTGSALVVAWTIIATAILLMDSIGAGNVREQAKREQFTYEARLNALSRERDKRAEEASAAQQRFSVALEQVSVMQSSYLASEDRRKELETGIEVIQKTLQRVVKERDGALQETDVLTAQLESTTGSARTDAGRADDIEGTVDFLTAALDTTAQERDQIASDAAEAFQEVQELEHEARLVEDRNNKIFGQLEEAVSVSLSPLDKMFRAAGMPTDRIIEEVRRGYSGQGGPLTPIAFSTKGNPLDIDSLRANAIIGSLDKMNMYRIAAEKAPFAIPVKSAFRFTSGFGVRRDPITGGSRMHSGTDFAGAHGTPIYATADGVVTHAGWSSGYGRLVKIQHQFGIETSYAHQSQIRVKVGQRVSRGDRIGDMGNTGRSTGTHLHYEVRVGGKPVNPMVYIKAANDVF
ncbi:DUF5930 domain-containing protein [Pseudogemmobacter sp. W21_MBD1_M6]|uniref:DUF5930 domain-containing protein n=1 Tax=Pseudogemmobacter sp. W21_MBD1_M6 TaxID=3240271 RepID=UPI003F980BB2